MKRAIMIGVLSLIVLFSSGCEKDTSLVYTGFVEEDIEAIVPHASGIITTLNVQEGDPVEKGDVLAEIDSRDLQIKRRKLMSQIESQSLSYDLLLDEIDDSDLKKLKKQVDTLEAQISLAVSSSTLINQNLVKMEALYDAGAISSSELDQAKLALEESQTKVGTLKNQRDQVMISYHTALEGVDERQLAQIEISIDQLNQDIEHIDIELEKMVITAPTSGTVQSLDVKVDDLCTVGNAIGEIDVENPYVIFYVDNTQLSTLGVGDIVKVWQDDQDESFEARIYEIANRAQFTPKNVTVKKDRQQLVYRIEALLPTESGFLPGMMVDITLGEY